MVILTFERLKDVQPADVFVRQAHQYVTRQGQEAPSEHDMCIRMSNNSMLISLMMPKPNPEQEIDMGIHPVGCLIGFLMACIGMSATLLAVFPRCMLVHYAIYHHKQDAAIERWSRRARAEKARWLLWRLRRNPTSWPNLRPKHAMQLSK